MRRERIIWMLQANNKKYRSVNAQQVVVNQNAQRVIWQLLLAEQRLEWNAGSFKIEMINNTLLDGV